MTKPDLLDPRLRQIAFLALTAIELPAPMEQVAKHWEAAAKVCPKGDVAMLAVGRRDKLIRARALIDTLLIEAGVADL